MLKHGRWNGSLMRYFEQKAVRVRTRTPLPRPEWPMRLREDAARRTGRNVDVTRRWEERWPRLKRRMPGSGEDVAIMSSMDTTSRDVLWIRLNPVIQLIGKKMLVYSLSVHNNEVGRRVSENSICSFPWFIVPPCPKSVSLSLFSFSGRHCVPSFLCFMENRNICMYELDNWHSSLHIFSSLSCSSHALCLSVSVCLSLSVCLSVCLSLSLSLSLSLFLSWFHLLYLRVHLHATDSLCWSVIFSVCLSSSSFYLSCHLSFQQVNDKSKVLGVVLQTLLR